VLLVIGDHTTVYAIVLRKDQAAVQSYFLTAPDSIAKRWIQSGASGWRLDVAGDPSFPNGYWESSARSSRRRTPRR